MRLSRRAALLGGLVAACGRRAGREAGTVVFKHQPLWGDPQPFRDLLAGFERARGVKVVTEVLPNASDVLHQFYMTALGGGAADFDVMVVDVAWVAELARAGWVADLSEAFPPAALRSETIGGAADVALPGGRTFAVPWYVDVGALYRRVDLVPAPPTTFAALEQAIDHARAQDPRLQGLLFQARQSEGLVCNAYEAIWGHGGEALRPDGRLAIDTPEAARGVSFLRDCVQTGRAPASVLSAGEEESRRAFERGNAVFMRNWPYAWAELQGPASPVRGRVEVSALPTVDGSPGAGTLGGYFVAVNAHVDDTHRALAADLVRHLTSHEASVTMATSYARLPARMSAYDDARVHRDAPFLARLRALAERARPRPVTPYYGMLSEVLQSELSGALAGIRPVQVALARAQRLADRIMGRA